SDEAVAGPRERDAEPRGGRAVLGELDGEPRVHGAELVRSERRRAPEELFGHPLPRGVEGLARPAPAELEPSAAEIARGRLELQLERALQAMELRRGLLGGEVPELHLEQEVG